MAPTPGRSAAVKTRSTPGTCCVVIEIDRLDRGMGVRRSDVDDVRLAREADVVDVVAAGGEEPRILDPYDPIAEDAAHLVSHSCSSRGPLATVPCRVMMTPEHRVSWHRARTHPGFAGRITGLRTTRRATSSPTSAPSRFSAAWVREPGPASRRASARSRRTAPRRRRRPRPRSGRRSPCRSLRRT